MRISLEKSTIEGFHFFKIRPTIITHRIPSNDSIFHSRTILLGEKFEQTGTDAWQRKRRKKRGGGGGIKRNFRGAERGHWHFVTGQVEQPGWITGVTSPACTRSQTRRQERRRKGRQRCQQAEKEEEREEEEEGEEGGGEVLSGACKVGTMEVDHLRTGVSDTLRRGRSFFPSFPSLPARNLSLFTSYLCSLLFIPRPSLAWMNPRRSRNRISNRGGWWGSRIQVPLTKGLMLGPEKKEENWGWIKSAWESWMDEAGEMTYTSYARYLEKGRGEVGKNYKH